MPEAEPSRKTALCSSGRCHLTPPSSGRPRVSCAVSRSPLMSNVRPPLAINSLYVSLREITAETVRSVCALAVAPSQASFVAPNAVSLAQALFAPEAWYRAIYLLEEPVGFVMLEDESLCELPPKVPQVGLWRFMVDAPHQRSGIGRAALLLVIEHLRAKRRFRSLSCSYVPGIGCPEAFYLGLDFVHTGKVEGVEVVLELPIPSGVV